MAHDDIEVVRAEKKAGVGIDLALLGERSVQQDTGCDARREGNTFTFQMSTAGEPLLVRKAMRDAIESTGCFNLLEDHCPQKRIPAEGTGEG